MKKTDSETFASPTFFFPAERLLAYRVARELLAEVARISQALSPAAELDAVRVLAARCGALVGGLVRGATARRR